MQREAMDMYTGVVPYLYGVLCRRLKCRRRYQKAEVQEEERCGLINGKAQRCGRRVVGIAVIISRWWKNGMSGDMVWQEKKIIVL
ncbi:hypothetical protein ACFX13_022469 [Malus domestica]